MAESPPNPRETIHVPLQPVARDFMDRVRESTGVPKTEAATRIFEWFASLDAKLRLAVLNRDEDTKREMTRLVLQQMAGLEPVDPAAAQSVADVTIDQAAKIIHLMTDRIATIGRLNQQALGELRARVETAGAAGDKGPGKRKGK